MNERMNLFRYGCTSQRVKHWLILVKYHIKVVKLED